MVLGGLAEQERHLIVPHTSEGCKRTRAHGVLFGRPRKLTPHQRREAIARRDTGNETLTDIARSYNVSQSTINRLWSTGGFKSWAFVVAPGVASSPGNGDHFRALGVKGYRRPWMVKKPLLVRDLSKVVLDHEGVGL
jgi:hypothetical protein